MEHDNQVACVIMESVLGEGPPEGFLQGVVDMAHRYGALAVFDEVKVGFRVAIGGGKRVLRGNAGLGDVR